MPNTAPITRDLRSIIPSCFCAFATLFGLDAGDTHKVRPAPALLGEEDTKILRRAVPGFGLELGKASCAVLIAALNVPMIAGDVPAGAAIPVQEYSFRCCGVFTLRHYASTKENAWGHSARGSLEDVQLRPPASADCLDGGSGCNCRRAALLQAGDSRGRPAQVADLAVP